MSFSITLKDKQILRELARKQLEFSQLPQMQRLKKDWIIHNRCGGGRPMIAVEVSSFYNDIIPALLKCESTEARLIEMEFYFNFINHELFGDDTIVRDYFPVNVKTWFKPFDIDISIDFAGSDSKNLGQRFKEIIKDLREDSHLLKKSSFGAEKTEAIEYVNALNGVFGNILPARLTGSCLYALLTQNIVHVMSMETMLLSMYDYPDDFKRMISGLADDYMEYFRFMEREGLVQPIVGDECLGQGSFCFTDELPGYEDAKKRTFTSRDVWGFLDSQETVGISPEMFKEFVFPYYKKIAGEFGLLSYGCCEPVDPIWECSLSKLENLRKLSISPWCNEEYMGEQLRGRKIVYHRKPSANYLGVGRDLDEDALRGHIRKTVRAAAECTLEFTQRDVYKLNSGYEKVRRFVEIIREECNDFK